MQRSHYPGNASFAPRALPRRAGAGFGPVPLDRAANARRGEACRRLRPNGKFPTLVDGDPAAYQTAAFAAEGVDAPFC